MKREKINHDSMKRIYDGLLKTFVAKNKDYGNSFERSLYQHGLIAGIVRMEDKMNRLSTLVNGDKDAQVASESLSDTLLDLSNYAAMSACWLMGQYEETRDEYGVKDEYLEEIKDTTSKAKFNLLYQPLTEDYKNDEVFKEVMKIHADMLSFCKGRYDAQHVDGDSFSVVPNDKKSVSVTGSGQQFFYNSDYIGKFVFDPHMLLTHVDDNGNEFKTPFIMSFNREGREGYLSLTYPYLKDYSDFNTVCENFVRLIDQNAINHDDKEFDIDVAGIDIPMDNILYDQLVTNGSSLMRQFANDECFNARYGNFLYGSQMLWYRDKKVFFVKCFVKNFSYPAGSQMDAIYFADTRELLTSISGEYIDIRVGDDGSFEWFVVKDGKYLGVDFKNYPRTPNYDKYLVKVDNFVWVDSEKLEDI